MPQSLIFQPICALAALTFVMLALIPVRRFRAGFSGAIRADDFKFGESARVPGAVSIPNRNYMNLLEMPVLFYLVCVLFYVTQGVDRAVLILAWSYVALRLLHSLIHVGYNNVYHRLAVFATSNFIVIALWALFFVSTLRMA